MRMGVDLCRRIPIEFLYNSAVAYKNSAGAYKNSRVAAISDQARVQEFRIPTRIPTGIPTEFFGIRQLHLVRFGIFFQIS